MRSPSGRVLTALSISGPIEHTGRQPEHQYGPFVMVAANRFTGSSSTVEDAVDL